MTSTPEHPDHASLAPSCDPPHSSSAQEDRNAGQPNFGPTGWVIAPTPVAVWLSGPLRSCPRSGHHPAFGEPPCAWRWPAQLWDSILTSYSRPDDLVLIADTADGPPLFQALDRGRRVAARIPSRSHRVATRLELRLERSVRDRRNTTVFADRRPAARRQPGTSVPRTSEGWPDRALRGQVDLMVVPPPCPADLPGVPAPSDAAEQWQHGVLAERCHLLRPGGVMAVLTRVTPDRAGAVDRIRPLLAQARQLGLSYLQHNPVVHAEVRDSRLEPTYGWDDPTFGTDFTDPAQYRLWRRLIRRRPDSSLGVGPVDVPRLHMPVHSDLVVLTRPSTRSGGSL